MNKTAHYKSELQGVPDWISYLKVKSGLPGKRANLELMHAFTALGTEQLFLECLEYKAAIHPTNSQGEFVAMCGSAGLGKLIASGKTGYFSTLEKLAMDTRWRVREGVAFALQYIGKENFELLYHYMLQWIDKDPMIQRAIVAGMCEPSLLTKKENARQVLDILHTLCKLFMRNEAMHPESFRVLKKGLSYGLSVAIAAYPEHGKLVFEDLLNKNDEELNKILKENLRKNRLKKTDPDWVAVQEKKLNKQE